MPSPNQPPACRGQLHDGVEERAVRILDIDDGLNLPLTIVGGLPCGQVQRYTGCNALNGDGS